jgi:(1->4)-alpha-D-glucan 1-alpha-D-glucosylmutase
VTDRTPRATYRLQLHPGFGFDAAAGIADYLERLGVSHAYFSPYLQAAEGSTHGYDVIDPRRVNEELGGDEAHTRLQAVLAEHGLGQVLDVVPNHMAISGTPSRKGAPSHRNVWWWDVLENGPSSRYAGHFDVDWDPPEAKLRNTVLMPVLGDHYGRVVEAGDIQLARVEGRFEIRYFDHVLPVAPRSIDGLLGWAAELCGDDSLAFIAHSLTRLPLATATDRVSVYLRHRDKEVLAAQLERLCAEEPAVAEAVDRVVAEVNADADLMDALLERQNYRLAFWRTAGRELDYRRFFDINTLVALRMEDDQVFADTHALILRWLSEGVLDGIRIDHVDGLRRPGQYLERLREAAPRAWIVVEKILEGEERLPERWPVDGTTGYDFLNVALRLFVDPAGEAPFTDLWHELTGDPTPWDDAVLDAKFQVLREVLAADLNRLTHLFVQLCETERRYRDFTRHELHELLREVLASFPVYRTYVNESGEISDHDEAVLDEAVGAARARRDDLDGELFDLVRDVLAGRGAGSGPVGTELRMRFQQVSGPVMAKAVEDTAFYRYLRLSSLNEVGGDPSWWSLDVDGFHARMAENQDRRPGAMLALSTHDTKRSEDVRARLSVLSELPEAWAAFARDWFETAARHRKGEWPDPATEYLVLQTLVGAHPLDAGRAVAYVEKATREAKVHTSWTDPDAGYDDAVRGYVEGVIADGQLQAALAGFVATIVDAGRVNGLAQKLVQLTAPGVPDTYQGTELWDLSLVDPDNRREVDYGERRRLLDRLDDLTATEAWESADTGAPKLLVVREALALRARRPEAFGAGEAGRYEPLAAAGPRAANVVAYTRGGRVAVVVPRLWAGVERAGGWEDTALVLPEGRWRDQFTGDVHDGGRRQVAELLGRFPVALLAEEEQR